MIVFFNLIFVAQLIRIKFNLSRGGQRGVYKMLCREKYSSVQVHGLNLRKVCRKLPALGWTKQGYAFSAPESR